jgi:hypothetical protein
MLLSSTSRCLKNNLNGSNGEGGPIVAMAFVDALNNQEMNVIVIPEVVLAAALTLAANPAARVASEVEDSPSSLSSSPPSDSQKL